MKVLVIDDWTVVRWGLRTFLTEEFAVAEVGEASNGPEALAALERKSWGLVVMDLLQRGRGGLDLLTEIKRRHPRTPVLVLSDGPDEHYGVRALRAGASGYVSKSARGDELAAAIKRVAEGGRYISEPVAQQLAKLVADGPRKSLHDWLSNRELEVLRGLAAGSSVGAVAREMKLSGKTVSTYRTRVLQKLKLTTNADLTRYALDHGLL
jgi:DNA-binding NarL/FixJ family response regulator